MARTTFVNPGIFSNPRRRKARKSSRRRRSHGMVRRRNAGISPFIQNPLILSNPRRKRARRRNPMSLPSVKGMIDSTLSYGGGAVLALTVNTVATQKIANPWMRRGAQLAAAILGGSMLTKQTSNAMGGAFAGAMMYPLIQDVAADLLGIGVGAGVSAKEADLDALAADLEDVLDDMSDEDTSELSDDDEEYAW